LKLPSLREVRELRGWSQGVLAKKAGVSRDSISNYETGQREAYPSTARKLADALNVSPAELEEPIDWRTRVITLEAEHLDHLVGAAKDAREALAEGYPEHAQRFLTLLEEGLENSAEALHQWLQIERGGEKNPQKSLADRLSELRQEMPDLQTSKS
jgi:transcriptional regulator with XRE-family HTH domain